MLGGTGNLPVLLGDPPSRTREGRIKKVGIRFDQ